MSISIKRPSLKFYGSSWKRAPWIISQFPEHEAYCEPCFGGGSVLFRKPICKLETVNDLDGRIVNFFLVLRERPEELVELLYLTPWSEEEYRLCLEIADDPLEDARRFFFSCWGSLKGGPVSGWPEFRWQKKLTRRSAAVKDVANLDHLLASAKRLKNVQILKRDALELIEKMLGTGALIYFDPPYLKGTTVRQRNRYRHDVSIAWHEDAAELLRQHDGPVVVSGYRSDLYAAVYEAYGWKRVERQFRTNSGGAAVECLWLSPITVGRLEAEG